MNRREFITLLGGGAVMPIVARAQERERMRRIGVLLPATADDAEFQARVGAFCKGCSNRAGASAATCGSTLVGPRRMPTTFADTQPNWSRWRRT